jgi:drug/metabolite transporter (DMT)-like permease
MTRRYGRLFLSYGSATGIYPIGDDLLSNTMAGGARPALGIAVMVAGMIILASTDAVSKHLTLSFAVIQILWVRFVVFAGVGTFLAFRKNGLQGLRTKRPVAQVARAVILNLANFIFVYSLSQMPMADAHSIMAIAPLLITAASVPLLGETVGIRRWLAILVAFGGMMIILRPGTGVFDPVSLVTLAGAGCFASYTILTKIISQDDSHETTLFYTGVIGFAMMSVLVPFEWIQPLGKDWFWLIVAGAGGTLAHVCIIMALHMAPASTLQPFNYTMLVWATVLGFLIFGDLPDAWTVSGALVIVASGLYSWHRERLVSK